MSLQNDINAGLAAISSSDASPKLALNQAGSCLVPVPMPASVANLTDNQLVVKVQISSTGQRFSLLTPLATLKGTPGQGFLEALFQRQFYADQVSGISLAINAEQETLIAVYHWLLDSITSDQFASLFQKFALAALDLIDEIEVMSRRERGVKPIHKGRSG